ncbi:hypothetical protein HZA87_04800 [Candidatus Uhrbacteria bacterium]|nr:hypothetical protein [Candidatus Uhrbacteria bacterium]
MGRRAEMGRGAQPKKDQLDTWVAPTKKERLAAKKGENQPDEEMTLDQQLNIAMMDKLLPNVDFHGMHREDVAFGIDKLLSENPGKMVRVIYGHGTGAIAGEVMNVLRDLSRGRGAKIEGFKPDVILASCVVKVK